jgi:DNA-binding protein H-NS
MMANNNSRDIIYVPEYMLDILVQLRHLLELYKAVRKSETELIELLTKEIEQISEEGHGNFFIETLINAYDYPRYFDNEQDDEEIYDVDPFTLSNRNNS